MSATDTLQALLGADWRPVVEVQARMEEAGYSPDETRTAKRKLGVSRDSGSVRRDGERWYWRLPPDGCPLCGRSWRESWALEGKEGDYYAGSRTPTPAMPEDDPAIATEAEPPSPTSSPLPQPRFEPAAAPTCNVCGRAGAMGRGDRCPYWSSSGKRCVGVMQ
jgi:hypothetical protein